MFYDQQKTESLADKAFPIKKYLLLHYFPLAVAPDVQIKSQITIGEEKKKWRKFKDAC